MNFGSDEFNIRQIVIEYGSFFVFMTNEKSAYVY